MCSPALLRVLTSSVFLLDRTGGDEVTRLPAIQADPGSEMLTSLSQLQPSCIGSSLMSVTGDGVVELGWMEGGDDRRRGRDRGVGGGTPIPQVVIELDSVFNERV